MFYKMHPYSGTGWKDCAKILLEGRTDIPIFPPGAGTAVLDIALLPYVHACSSEKNKSFITKPYHLSRR